jgi:hypothetical protein
LYVRSTCDVASTEIGCDDDNPGTTWSTLNLESLEAGTYFLVVDGFGTANVGGSGPFNLSSDINTYDTCDGAFAVPVDTATNRTLTGSTSGLNNNASGTCGGAGAEVFFAIDVTQQATVTIDTVGSAINTVIYLQSTCGSQASELACSDNAPGLGTASQVSQSLAPAGTSGNFTVNITGGP